MDLITLDKLKVFWEAVKSYTGKMNCIADKSVNDVNGDAITDTYVAKKNVANKGNAGRPVYFDANGIANPITNFDGNSETCSRLGDVSVGSEYRPIYLQGGVPQACSKNVGGAFNPIYMSNGVFRNFKESVGTSSQPIYLKDGVLSVCDIFPKQLILDSVYPVGYLYIATNSISPATLFGGTWKQIKGRFLLGCGANDVANNMTTYGDCAINTVSSNAGQYGGEAGHSLTTDEMPKHKHSVNLTTTTNGNHRHGTWGEAYKNPPEGIYDETKHMGSEGGRDYDNYLYNTTLNGNHNHSVSGDTDNKGNNASHNNIPPFLSVYMWERIA